LDGVSADAVSFQDRRKLLIHISTQPWRVIRSDLIMVHSMIKFIDRHLFVKNQEQAFSGHNIGSDLAGKLWPMPL